MSLKDPKNAIESDPWFGSFVIVVFSIVMPIPFAVIAMMFVPLIGYNAAGILWIVMCILWPVWMIWVATKPFNLR